MGSENNLLALLFCFIIVIDSKHIEIILSIVLLFPIYKWHVQFSKGTHGVFLFIVNFLSFCDKGNMPRGGKNLQNGFIISCDRLGKLTRFHHG